MAENGLRCRYCGRTIAVPASHCPWCGKEIMVICAACKQYTDNQQATCQHCGAPLVADRMEEVRQVVELDPELAQIVLDRERAQLIASGVIVQYPSGFFFDDGQRRAVMADLFGALPNPYRIAASLLFAAIAYLVQRGYCALEPVAEREDMRWESLQLWDGQVGSLEGGFARRAGMGMTIRKVVDQVVADEMDFRFEVKRPSRALTPVIPKPPRVRDRSRCSSTTAVVERSRQAELPEHQEAEACRETYLLLRDFVHADPARAHYLVEVIAEVLDWFRRYEEDPSIALTR